MRGIESFGGIENLNEIGQSIMTDAKEVSLTPSLEPQAELFENSIESFLPAEGIEHFGDNSVERTEVLHDVETTEAIAEHLESIDEIKYDNWTKLSLGQRESLLQRLENDIAQIQHRPPMSIKVIPLPSDKLGYQDPNRNEIAINSSLVMHDNPFSHRQIVDTIVHEGRHAYQHYNVDVRCTHESLSEVNSWKENFSDSQYGYYQSTGQLIWIPTQNGYAQMSDFRLYYYQPVEIDARNFASDVLSHLEAKGVVCGQIPNDQG